MRSKFYFILYLFIITFVIKVAQAENQCEILYNSIKEMMTKPLDVNKFTSPDMGCCNFNFIGCKGIGADRKIINLELNGLNMSLNQIPESLSGLTDLERIGITNCGNNLKIPLFLKDLPNLTALEIYNTKIDGNIPENIIQMKNLKILTIVGNNIDGPIPDSIGTLENLEHLIIQGNLIKGKIPETIGNLKKIETLHITGCLIEGPIPMSIGRLTDIKNINLSNNSLDGEIPDSIGNLGKLERLDLNRNKFKGQIPETITKLKELKYLDISENQFKDTAEFSASLPKLVDINLSNSGIYDVVPKYSSVKNCNFDTEHFCIEDAEPQCGFKGTKCTDNFMEKLSTLKSEKKTAQKRRKEMSSEEDEPIPKSKYVISLIIVLVPLVGIASFLHWYNRYSNKKEDELVIKHIDMINTRHSYIYSDAGSDAYLIAKTPNHRKLNPCKDSQVTRNIFDDDELETDEDTINNIEEDVAERIIEGSIHNSIPRHIAESFHADSLPGGDVNGSIRGSLPRDALNDNSFHSNTLSLPRDIFDGVMNDNYHKALNQPINILDNVPDTNSVHTSSYYSHPNNSNQSLSNSHTSIHSHNSNPNSSFHSSNPFTNLTFNSITRSKSQLSQTPSQTQPQNSSFSQPIQYNLNDQQNTYQLDFENISPSLTDSINNSLHLFSDHSRQ